MRQHSDLSLVLFAIAIKPVSMGFRVFRLVCLGNCYMQLIW